MTKEQQLEHRLAMIADDLKVLRKFIYEQGMNEVFYLPTRMSEHAWTHLNNIEIACDLTNDECLNWQLFNVETLNNIIEKLKEIDVDGENMQYIIEKVGMTDQMYRQLVMSKPTEDTEILLQERKSFK
jgi:hypothetical protein